METPLLISPHEPSQEASDHETAGELQAPGAKVVHKALLLEGEEELERSPAALAWSAFAAGLSLGLSLVAEGALRRHLPDAA